MNEVFGSKPLADFLNERLKSAEKTAEAKTVDNLREDLTDITPRVVVEITDKYSLQPLRMVAPDSPGRPAIYHEHVVFSIELSGSTELLNFKPDPIGEIPPEISRIGFGLAFSYPKPAEDKDYKAITEKLAEHIAIMREVLEGLREQVEKYNNSELPGRIRPILERTKQARKEEDAIANKLIQEFNKRRGDKRTNY
jgi:hypothetical protein